HMWVEPKKMDDPQVFRDAFLSSGIDIDGIAARSQQDDVKKKLIENTNDAVARGTFGSPTFFIGDEIYFGKDSLRDVEEEIVAQLGGLRRKAALAGLRIENRTGPSMATVTGGDSGGWAAGGGRDFGSLAKPHPSGD